MLAAHPDILASWLDGTTENRRETEDSQRLHLLNDARYCTCYFMLLFLPETLGAVINVGYYETPEGFCCADGHSHPEGKKNKKIQASKNVCFLLSKYLHEV